MTDLLLVRAVERRALSTDKAGPGVGNAEARTFFALRSEAGALTTWIFAPLTDPRSANLHPHNEAGLADGAELLRSVGLRPEDHTLWYIPGRQIEEILYTWTDWHDGEADDNAVDDATGGRRTHDRILPGNWVTWGRHVTWYRVSEVNGRDVTTDAAVDVGGEYPVRAGRLDFDVDSITGDPRFESRAEQEMSEPEREKIRDYSAACFGTSEATDPKEQVIPYADMEPDELRARIVALEEDRTKVAEALKSEATRRDWCEEYEAFVERVNPSLNEPAFEKRERAYNVPVIVDLYVTGADLEQARTFGSDWVRSAVNGRSHDKIRVFGINEGR